MGDSEKREIAESYNTLGYRIYDLRYSEEQKAKYNLLLKTISPTLETVLDIGCGTGLLMDRLESHSIGLDVSSSLISAAYSRLKQKKIYFLILGDAGKLPFRDQSIDVLFSVTVLQNIPDKLSAIDEMKRVGKGKAVLTGLKKAFTKEKFERLFVSAQVKSFKILDSREVNDWIAFFLL
jgi:ubiquinone/menaquinone biosynthesis C-methylase UbiE